MGFRRSNPIPADGAAGRVLAKKTNADFDLEWDLPGGAGAALRNWALDCDYTLGTAPTTYINRPTALSTSGTPAYTAKGGQLTDGQIGGGGSNSFNDGSWVGFLGGNGHVDTIRIDLGAARSISEVRVYGLEDNVNAIDRASRILLEYSDDDAIFTTVEDRAGLVAAATSIRRWLADFTFAAISHRYWRVSVTQTANFIFLSEIAVLGA